MEGEALDGTKTQVPGDLAKPAVVLIGYVQDAQFDIDRWLLGLAQMNTPVNLTELPAIRGFVPGMFAERIDEGMRSGIPKEDWGAVVTVYDDADKLVQLTGNERPRNARVLLLDEKNKIVWFHDRGFSVGSLKALDAEARQIASSGE